MFAKISVTAGRVGITVEIYVVDGRVESMGWGTDGELEEATVMEKRIGGFPRVSSDFIGFC